MTKWTKEQVDTMLNDLAGPKDRKRQRIVEAATSLFIEQGYRKTSLEEIARLAGVAKGTVYLYAKSKAELLMQALATEKLKQRHLIDHVMDEKASPRERLRRYIEVAFVGTVRIPLYSRVLAGDMDILMALNEVSPLHNEQKPQELGTDYLEQLIGEIAPGALSPELLKERAKSLLILILQAYRLGDPRVLQGLSVERAAAHIADIIAGDIAAPRSQS